MMAMEKFDPFEDRLARDIRNALSRTLMKSLETLDLEPVKKKAEIFLNSSLSPSHSRYIDKRLSLYNEALSIIKTRKISDPARQALILWDLELFFEVHERLEGIWINSKGIQKKALQGLIRAAGVFVHLSRGNRKAGLSMAQKAINDLTQNRQALQWIEKLDLLIETLGKKDPSPVRLLL